MAISQCSLLGSFRVSQVLIPFDRQVIESEDAGGRNKKNKQKKKIKGFMTGWGREGQGEGK